MYRHLFRSCTPDALNNERRQVPGVTLLQIAVQWIRSCEQVYRLIHICNRLCWYLEVGLPLEGLGDSKKSIPIGDISCSLYGLLAKIPVSIKFTNHLRRLTFSIVQLPFCGYQCSRPGTTQSASTVPGGRLPASYPASLVCET